MIIGDPIKFAFRFDFVSLWSTSGTWHNGIYEIYIDGVCYPKELYVTEFNINLKYFLSGFIHKMTPIPNGFISNIESSNLEIDDLDSLIENKIVMNLESSDMLDAGIEILFFFNNEADFILLNDNGNRRLFSFDSGYIIEIFKRLENIDYENVINFQS